MVRFGEKAEHIVPPFYLSELLLVNYKNPESDQDKPQRGVEKTIILRKFLFYSFQYQYF